MREVKGDTYRSFTNSHIIGQVLLPFAAAVKKYLVVL